MTTEVLSALVRVNLAAGAAILAVMLLRLPVRRLFGPEVAYRLWVIPPLAAAACLLPPRVAAGAEGVSLAAGFAQAAPLLLVDWAIGAVIVFTLFWRAQVKFLKVARAGRAGPAVVGVFAPRILMPADDGGFTDEERVLIRAHEREHVTRQDPRAGALAAAFQCLAWFNPLVHLAAYLLRLDQELACDAAVLRRHPKARATYAKALVKTQLAAQPLPFGCYWPARGVHPLEVRVALLKRGPSRWDLTGGCLVAAAALGAGVAAWATQPPIPPHEPYPAAQWLAEQPGGTMSVMLLTWPARDKR